MTVNKLDNLKMLTERNSVAKVLAAGFWESDVLTELLEADPQKLIIFEPDNGLYTAAKANYADTPNVDVRNITLADKTGEADYVVFKPNRFSSLLKPKHLLKIYRKNNNDNVIKINVSTIQNICQEEKLTQSAGNILLLGANCSSSILSDAEQTQCLRVFDVIVVRQPKKGLYETEEKDATLSSALQKHKFNVVQELSHDPMYTQFIFVRDHQSDKINTLQTRVTEAETKSAELVKKLEDAVSRSSRFEASVAELTERISELDKKLVHTNIQSEQLSAENTLQQTEKKQLVAKVAALQSKHNEQAESQKNKDAQIAELTQQRDQQTKVYQEAKQRAEALKAQNDKLSAENTQQLTEKEELAVQVSALQSKYNEQAESQKNKDAQIAELTQQRDQQAKGHQETKQRAEALKAQKDKLSAENTQQLTEKEELAAQVAALQSKHNEQAESQKNKDAQIAELTQQRDQQAKGHQETKQQAEALKAQNDKLSAENTQQQSEKEQLAAKVAALQTKHNEQAESQKNKDKLIAERTEQRDQQTQAHHKNKQWAETLKVENDKLSTELALQKVEKEQLVAQVAALQANEDEQVDSQKHVDAKMAELIQQRDQQAKGHQETKKQTEALEAKIETLCDEITLLKERNVKLSNHNQQLMQQTDELTSESQREIDELNQEREQQAEALKAKIEKLGAENTQLQTENEQFLGQVASLQTKYSELEESHKNKDLQITDRTQQRDEQARVYQETKQEVEELKVQHATLSAEQMQQQTEKEQLLAQVASLQAKCKELAESQNNKDTQIAELTQQRDQHAKEHHANKQLAENLSKQCQELKSYSAERQKSADLALRLQTKAQTDLDNSRAQFQLKHINEQKLVELVSELRVKLQQAAEYYYVLQKQHPELSEVSQEQFAPAHTDDYETLSVERPRKKGKAPKRKKQGKSANNDTSGRI